MALRKLKIILALGILYFLFFNKTSFAFAASPNLLPGTEANSQEALSKAIKKKISRGAFFLLGIESKLKYSQDELKILKQNKNALKGKIAESEVHIENLESQLDNLEKLIGMNQTKIRSGELQIAEYENSINILENEITQIENIVQDQIQALEANLSTYYLHTATFFGEGGEDLNLLALLSTEISTGEVLKADSYLLFLQNATQELAKSLMVEEGVLDLKRRELDIKKEKVRELQDLLEGEKRTLRSAQESKKRLLTETQGKQLIYETLLELSKKEEIQVKAQIQRLRENFEFFQEKLGQLNTNRDEEQTYEDGIGLYGNSKLAWPVSPNLGLSALFHDSTYEKAIGVQHNAIDIKATQGSALRAAADGVVTKASDNDMAYSYVIIAHPEKLLTLYGHLSEIMVEEGEIVRQGQLIGLSGGMPGTRGAGWLTTGPHLHFEVFKDWKHVDPLEYLPLELVPVASLPDTYLEKLVGEEKVSRVNK